MEEKIRIAVDAMGGDNAPEEIIKGVIAAVNKTKELSVILVGRQQAIASCLNGQSYPQGAITVRNAEEVIETADHPVEAIRHKKDSSLVVALQMVRKGEADACISAGNSGAVLVGGQGIVGRIRGVQRPPFASVMPTQNGAMMMLDCGANVDVRPEHLAQWAVLGSIYMKHVEGVKDPRVGIVNIGAEEEKGNALVKETFPLLKEMDSEGRIRFTGSCEARDVPYGSCDVAVCDGFTGNVIIKMYEGTGTLLLSEMKNAFYSGIQSKLGALLVKNALKRALGKYDVSQYGGAPVLGLKSLVVKMHGSAKAKEVKRAIEQCVQFYQEDIAAKSASYLENGNMTDLGSVQSSERKAWSGKCLAIIAADRPGSVTVVAEADGLQPAEVTFTASSGVSLHR